MGRALVNKNESFVVVKGYAINGEEYLELTKMFRFSQIPIMDELIDKFQAELLEIANDTERWDKMRSNPDAFIKSRPLSELLDKLKLEELN